MEVGLRYSELTNQNSIHKKIKHRLKAGNSVQTLLFSQFLSKNLKLKYIKQ